MNTKMRRTSILATVLIFQAFIQMAGADAAEPPKEIPPELILQRFTVAKDGEALLVPVRIDGKDHQFLVDTGCTKTVFDAPLLRGAQKESQILNTPGGQRVEMKAYDPPVASVGKLSFPSDTTVLSMDFKAMRDVAEQPIEGMLGMDFLGRYVVHIDFDKGELLFLKSAPEEGREILPMFWKPDEVPMVAGTVTGSDWIYFVIDTGMVGQSSGTLVSEETRRLAAAGKLLKVGDAAVESAAGRVVPSIFRGIFLKVGTFAIEDPILDETVSRNWLALRFWSRFVTTFDFPGQRVLLSKGQNYQRADQLNRSGLFLRTRNDAVTIEHVSSESVGSAAGIRTGDVLLEVGGLKAGPKNLKEVRARLRQTGKVDCLVRREGKELRLTLDIPK